MEETMPEQVKVAPSLISWARERSGVDVDELARSFPKLSDWERGDRQPTLRQLERFSRATFTPFGMFFLNEPPILELPIPDLRTKGSTGQATLSPNLLDTVAICEQRQEWYRSFLIAEEADPLDFVDSVDLKQSPSVVADQMRQRLGYGVAERRQYSTWEDGFQGLREKAEAAGVLVMISGIVGLNTHRRISVDDFRGFTLVDEYAPLVFINGTDSKAAQMFTLCHELAHVWLGQSAVSSGGAGRLQREPEPSQTELWCNKVAGELLVPQELLRGGFRREADLPSEVRRLSREYRVSTLVILHRLYDLGLVPWERFRGLYQSESKRTLPKEGDTGGNFYQTFPARVSRRFLRAVIADTFGGRTQYRDAYLLLGIRSQTALEQLGRQLGVL